MTLMTTKSIYIWLELKFNCFDLIINAANDISLTKSFKRIISILCT